MTTTVEYDHCLRTGLNLSHIQIACDGLYLALPLTKTTIGVWTIQDITAKPIELEGHHGPLNSLCLGHQGSPKLLCSASKDHVIVWDVKHAWNCVKKGNKPRGVILGSGLGEIWHCSFSPDDQYVAVCRDMDVVVLKTACKSTVAILEGHGNIVTSAEFCPHYHSTLVSISEDRTFKVWDISDASLVYQSHILTASPLITMAMDFQHPQMALGTADGQVFVIDLTDGNNFRCLHKVNLENSIEKIQTKKMSGQKSDQDLVISSLPSWKQTNKLEQTNRPDGDMTAVDDIAELGYTVQGLYYTYLPSTAQESQPSFFNSTHSHVKELFELSPMLMVATTGALLQINAKTMEICDLLNLQDSLPVPRSIDNQVTMIGAAGAVCFTQGYNPHLIHCVIGSQFQNLAHLLNWKHAASSEQLQSHSEQTLSGAVSDLDLQQSAMPFSPTMNSEDSNNLNVLSNIPLCSDSVLRSEMILKNKDTPKKKDEKGKKPGPGKDQPLTFHTKVKSSGYTEAPRKTMFQPKTTFSKTSTSKPAKGNMSDTGISDVLRHYPSKADPPSVLQSRIPVAERPTPITSVKCSGDGQFVGVALSNKVAVTYKVPWKDTHTGTGYVGHNHIVNDICWSNTNQYIVTASDDKTAVIWRRGVTDPLMVLNTTKSNSADKEGQVKDKDNKPFSKEVKHARFYYLNKFLLVTNGNNLYMYKYHLDAEKQDVKRYLTKCRYKVVLNHSSSAQQITSLSAANSFYSYLVLYAGSDRTIDIFDMNVGKIVRTVPDVHSRSAHVIKQNLGSSYSSHPSEAYNLFVTAAVGDCVKLWDTRQKSCLRRYEGHMTRTYPCGLDISPCGRYIATGSEDRNAYIYDIRGGTYCQKLSGHSDTVTDLSYHPLHSQIITSTLDGHLQLFSTK